ISIRMDLAAVRRVMRHAHDSYRHTIDPLRRTRLALPGRDRQVPVNVEYMVGNVYRYDLAHGCSPATNDTIPFRPSQFVPGRRINRKPLRAPLRRFSCREEAPWKGRESRHPTQSALTRRGRPR